MKFTLKYLKAKRRIQEIEKRINNLERRVIKYRYLRVG